MADFRPGHGREGISRKMLASQGCRSTAVTSAGPVSRTSSEMGSSLRSPWPCRMRLRELCWAYLQVTAQCLGWSVTPAAVPSSRRFPFYQITLLSEYKPSPMSAICRKPSIDPTFLLNCCRISLLPFTGFSKVQSALALSRSSPPILAFSFVFFG